MMKAKGKGKIDATACYNLLR